MRVLIADKFEADGIAGLEALGCQVFSEPELGPETLPDALKRTEAEVLVVRSTKGTTISISRPPRRRASR